LLGGSQLGQQQSAAAAPLLLAGSQGLQQRAATIPAADQVRRTDALERLVQLSDACWGKKEEAARWRRERDQMQPDEKK
jgi:hypothetical protein